MHADGLAKSVRRTAAIGVAAVVFGWLATAVSATVTIPRSIKRMVQVADLVVEATVLQYQPRSGTVEQGTDCPAVDLAYTDIVLRANQVYKNRLSNQFFLVRVLGGRVENGRILRDTYLPFRTGERVLLFLQMNGSDDFPFVGFHQGIFRFRARGPNGTMPDLDEPDACTGPECPQLVVDGRDHLVVGFRQGFASTLPFSRLPLFRVVVGPGQAVVPPEPSVPSGGVFPAGAALPTTLATPQRVRQQVRAALQALGLPTNPPQLGDPAQPLVDELRPGEPIVRCGLPAQLSDEPEAFEVVPGGDVDPPIDPGPDERSVHP